jgi:hypothetical protein
MPLICACYILKLHPSCTLGWAYGIYIKWPWKKKSGPHEMYSIMLIKKAVRLIEFASTALNIKWPSPWELHSTALNKKSVMVNVEKSGQGHGISVQQWCQLLVNWANCYSFLSHLHFLNLLFWHVILQKKIYIHGMNPFSSLLIFHSSLLVLLHK